MDLHIKDGMCATLAWERIREVQVGKSETSYGPVKGVEIMAYCESIGREKE
jgi:hypothetical protein